MPRVSTLIMRFRRHSGMYQLPSVSKTTPMGLSMDVSLAGPPGGLSPAATFSMVAAASRPLVRMPAHTIRKCIRAPLMKSSRARLQRNLHRVGYVFRGDLSAFLGRAPGRRVQFDHQETSPVD